MRLQAHIDLVLNEERKASVDIHGASAQEKRTDSALLR
jgi:hypothetical protein